MKTYSDALQYIKNELPNHYPEGEINSIIAIIFDQTEHLSLSQIHLKKHEHINPDLYNSIVEIVKELKNNKPIQYILGETEFFDLKFKVNPDVLIPRPETEELVDWIIKENDYKKDLSILDIGTGSGCIAVALGKNLNCKKITAFDISKKAIKIAKKNSKLNHVKIYFKKIDILKKIHRNYNNKFNIIVSNPPYITNTEQKNMNANILNYEPHKALFVPDDNPLLFYNAISQYAKNNLHSNGQVYFEINETYGTEVFNLLLEYRFRDVNLKKDINGKDRMIKAVL